MPATAWSDPQGVASAGAPQPEIPAQPDGSSAFAASAPPPGSTSRGVIIHQAQKPVAPAVVAPVAAPVAKPMVCARPFAKPDLATTGYDQPGQDGISPDKLAKFDRAVSRALRAGKPAVVVDVATPWKLDTPAPPPLDRWLGQVKGAGGSLSSAEYCQKTRGFFAMFGRMFKARQEDRLAVVNDYDAVLQVNGGDQKVTQVLFRRRAGH